MNAGREFLSWIASILMVASMAAILYFFGW